MSSKHGGTCPRCKQTYTEYPALSRVDNKTDICSKCGTAEAMWDFAYRGSKPMPPVDRPVK
jgi:hypothetical protein